MTSSDHRRDAVGCAAAVFEDAAVFENAAAFENAVVEAAAG